MQHTVEVEREGQTLHITHDGETFTVILEGGTAPSAAAASAPVVSGSSASSAPSPVAPPAAAPAATTSAAPGDVVAPMTGTVRELKVAAGDAVTEGQLVLIMEAMKMDIEVVAPAAGAVSEVLVRDGQSVVEAEVLARIG